MPIHIKLASLILLPAEFYLGIQDSHAFLTLAQGITGTDDRRSAPLLDMGVHAIDAAAR